VDKAAVLHKDLVNIIGLEACCNRNPQLAYPEDRERVVSLHEEPFSGQQWEDNPWYGGTSDMREGCYIDGVPIEGYDWDNAQFMDMKLLENPNMASDYGAQVLNFVLIVESGLLGSEPVPPTSILYRRGERARELAAEIELHFGRMSFNPANQTIAQRFASRHELVGGDVRTVHRLRLVRRALQIYFTTVEEDLVHAYTIDNSTNRKRNKQSALTGVFNRWFGHSTANRPLQA
jgi:hypothetical protein